MEHPALALRLLMLISSVPNPLTAMMADNGIMAISQISKTRTLTALGRKWRAMGYDTKTEVCGHGFRTMARGALGESGLWSDDAIERQLSHSERNNVRAAYIHTSEHLDERRLMIQWWADYLDRNKKESITPYDFARQLK